VAEVVDLEVTGALTDLNRQLTRQLFMDGDGLVAQCGTTTTTNVVSLNAANGFNAILSVAGWPSAPS
jgi:hypothetical protein